MRFRLGLLLSVAVAVFALTCWSDSALGPGRVAAIVPTASCDPAPVGLVAWWPGDGNALDVRSRKNGTVVNSSYAAGKVGQAFAPTGLPAITHADDPRLNLQVFTLEAWVTATTFSCGTCAAFVMAKSGSTGNFGYELDVRNNGSVNFYINGGIGGGHAGSAAGVAINDGSFHHLAATYDGAVMKLYIDGSVSGSADYPGGVSYEQGSQFHIGSRDFGSTVSYPGLIDEPAIYDRVLSAAEIAAISGAGSSGKCKPTATEAPGSPVGWWPGDGDARDIAVNPFSFGPNSPQANGTFNGSYTVGKVSQAFSFDGVDDVLTVPTNGFYNAGEAGLSGETWIYPKAVANAGPRIFDFDQNSSNNRWLFALIPNAGAGAGAAIHLNINGVTLIAPDGSIPLNQWSHVAFTYDEFSTPNGHAVIYVNGVAVATGDLGNQSTNVTNLLRIGNDTTGTRQFNGYIDEPTLYDAVLTSTEIQSIYNAGLAGKLKDACTSVVANAPQQNCSSVVVKPRRPNRITRSVTNAPTTIAVTVGDAMVRFPDNASTGITQEIPLSLTGLPTLPLRSVGLTYDVATTVTYSGTATICFNLPALTAQFSSLHIEHLVNNSWIDVTASTNSSPNLCTTSLTSFSPFAIVTNAPTAARVSISGRVLTPGRAGLKGATLMMTDARGQTRTVVTNAFGYYSLDGVTSGESYVFVVSARRFVFSPKVVNVNGQIADLDFVSLY